MSVTLIATTHTSPAQIRAMQKYGAPLELSHLAEFIAVIRIQRILQCFIN